MSEVRRFSEKNIIRWIVAFVILSRIALAFRSEEKIYSRPYYEDSFYLFNCAEHFARGEGFTCDGRQPTNGVQPLIVLCDTPLFLIAGADKLLALRLGFILTALFDSLSVIFIAKLLRALQKKPAEEGPAWKSPPVIGAFLWATLYSVFVHTGGGMETGVYSVLLLASLYYYTTLVKERKHHDGNIVQWIGFGIVLGLAVLARIDAVFLVAAIAIYEVFKRKKILTAVIVSGVAFLVSSPWWWYNYRLFGSIVPQSGVAESLEKGLLGENLRRGAIVIGDILTVFFFLPNYALPPWFHYFWMGAILAIVLWLANKFALKKYLADHCLTVQFIPYYWFCGFLVTYYIFFFSAPHFLPRYFHPLRIIWIVLFCCAAPKILNEIRILYSQRKALTLAVGGILIIGALTFSTSRYAYYFLLRKESDFYRMGQFALAHPNVKIGMWQSGTTGFISPNIVNLDGKVNHAALKANLKNDIGEYVAEQKLTYVADWPNLIGPVLISAAKHGAEFQYLDSAGSIKIYKR